MFKNIGGKIPGDNFPVESLLGGNFPGGSFPDTVFFLKSRLLFNAFRCFCIFVNKHFTNFTSK